MPNRDWLATAVLLVLAVAGFIAGGCSVKTFLDSTQQSLDPPPATQAYDANAAFEQYMPAAAELSYFNIFVTYSGQWPCSVSSGSDSAGAETATQSIVELPTLETFFDVVSSSLRSDTETEAMLGAFGNYYLLNYTKMHRIADHLVAKDNRSVTTPLTCKATRFSKAAARFGNALKRAVVSNMGVLLNQTALAAAGYPADAATQFTVGVNGLPLFLESIVATSKTDMEIMNAVVLPLSMVIIGLRLRSIRLILVTAFGLGGAFCVSFGAMAPLTRVMDVSSSAPLLMMALAVALSLSFSLFCLGRFCEEIRRGLKPTTAVIVAAKTAGFSSSISCLALIVALASLAMMPVAILRSLSIACVVTVASVWIYSVVCLFAWLWMFPAWWAAGVSHTPLMQAVSACCAQFCKSTDDGETSTDKSSDGKESEPSTQYSVSTQHIASGPPPDSFGSGSIPNSEKRNINEERAPSISPRQDMAWKRMGNVALLSASCVNGERMVKMLRRRWLCAIAILAVFAFGGLCASEAAALKTSDNYLDYLGRHSQATKNYENFVKVYGYGFTEPFRILFALDDNDVPSNVTIFDAAVWDAGKTILRRIVDDPILGNETHLAGPMVVGPTFFTEVDLLTCWYKCPDLSIYAFLFTQVAPNRRAMYTILTAKFDPAGARGWAFYQRLLQLLNEPVPNAPRIRVWVKGTGPDTLDVVHQIYERFPVLAVLCTVLVFVVVLVGVRAPLCALRTALNAALCEAIVFGCCVAVYQRNPGDLQWTSAAPLHTMGSIPFIMPVVVFALTMGLAVAFDTYMTSRLAENGVTTPSSVAVEWAKGMSDVSVAGLVSVVAMAGLMLSEVPLMNAMGLCCIIAAAVPSLLCQGVVTPCAVLLLGEAGWWPRFGLRRCCCGADDDICDDVSAGLVPSDIYDP
jgi:hypothetical protein